MEDMGNYAYTLFRTIPPLGNHGLICNGAYVNGEGKFDEMVKMSIYLSSKYGQILAGQMIELSDGKLKN